MAAPIFDGKKEVNFFLAALTYYLYEDPPVKFSLYRMKPEAFSHSLEKKFCTLMAYCIMPTHFHLLLQQESDGGIQILLRKTSSSFAHYFGIKHEMHGHIFEGNFKAVHIENNEQLLHVSRYIHLNPVTAYMVENPQVYSHSSYRNYIDKTQSGLPVEPKLVLEQFRSRKGYERFVLDQKQYQRDLEKIKYLMLDD